MTPIEERYGLDRWSGHQSRMIRKPLPVLEGVEGLTLERRRPLEGAGRGFIDYYRRANDAVRVAVTITEHASVRDAHAGLISILSLVMAQRLPSCDEKGLKIGDVCFCSLGNVNEKIFFARANVVIRVASVGRETIDVSPIAVEIDRQLLLKA